jgi:prevent-host-death family protein
MKHKIDIAISNSYISSMKISVADAKNKLPELIKAAEDGENVTICRRGVPVVDLVPTKATTGEKPKFGTLKGRLVIHDLNWWKPMTEEEVEQFVEGRS